MRLPLTILSPMGLTFPPPIMAPLSARRIPQGVGAQARVEPLATWPWLVGKPLVEIAELFPHAVVLGWIWSTSPEGTLRKWQVPLRTLPPTPHTIHPIPYALHPIPYTPRPMPCTLHPKCETPAPDPPWILREGQVELWLISC